MNLINILNNSAKKLESVSTTPRLDAEILISTALKVKNRLNLYINKDQEIDHNYEKKISELISKRLKFKPVSKIINSKGFWNFDYDISKNVLIPRPETEVLIDLVASHIQRDKKINFFDIGCGSGCISLSLLDVFKNSKGLAIDISKEAIENTKINLKKFYTSAHLRILQKCIFTFKTKEMFDLIISNPPYLKLHEFINLDKSIKMYEPKTALVGDNKKGVKFFYRIIKNFKKNLKLNGILALEIGNNQFLEIKQLLRLHGFVILNHYKLVDSQVRCILARKIEN